jgi:hypothetical protein
MGRCPVQRVVPKYLKLILNWNERTKEEEEEEEEQQQQQQKQQQQQII